MATVLRGATKTRANRRRAAAAAWSRARVGEGAHGVGAVMTDLAVASEAGAEAAGEAEDAVAAHAPPPRRPSSLCSARKYVMAAEASADPTAEANQLRAESSISRYARSPPPRTTGRHSGVAESLRRVQTAH